MWEFGSGLLVGIVIGLLITGALVLFGARFLDDDEF